MVTGFLPIIRQFGARVHPALTAADVFTGSSFYLQAVPRPGHSLCALRSRSSVLLEVLQCGRPPRASPRGQPPAREHRDGTEAEPGAPEALPDAPGGGGTPAPDASGGSGCRHRPDPVGMSTGRTHRHGLMLLSLLAVRHQAIAEAGQALELVRQSAELRRELRDPLETLANRIRSLSERFDARCEVPLASHATYSLGESVAAYRYLGKNGALNQSQTGILWVNATKTELLFVTLEKSDRDFSQTTRYADHPISPTLFNGICRTELPPIPAPGVAMPGNGIVSQTSRYFLNRSSGAAMENLPPAIVLAGPTAAAMSRNGRCRAGCTGWECDCRLRVRNGASAGLPPGLMPAAARVPEADS